MAPTLTAMPLRVGGLPSALLAGGAHSAAVLSERGRVLDELELPVRTLTPTLSLSTGFQCPSRGPSYKAAIEHSILF